MASRLTRLVEDVVRSNAQATLFSMFCQKDQGHDLSVPLGVEYYLPVNPSKTGSRCLAVCRSDASSRPIDLPLDNFSNPLMKRYGAAAARVSGSAAALRAQISGTRVRCCFRQRVEYKKTFI